MDHKTPVFSVASAAHGNVLDIYMQFYNHCVALYGPKTCVLILCGIFYNVYGYTDSKGNVEGNIAEVAELMQLELTKRSNKKIITTIGIVLWVAIKIVN